MQPESLVTIANSQYYSTIGIQIYFYIIVHYTVVSTIVTGNYACNQSGLSCDAQQQQKQTRLKKLGTVSVDYTFSCLKITM